MSQYFFKSKEVASLKNCHILSGSLPVDALLCNRISEPLVLGLGFNWYLIHNEFLIFERSFHYEVHSIDVVSFLIDHLVQTHLSCLASRIFNLNTQLEQLEPASRYFMEELVLLFNTLICL